MPAILYLQECIPILFAFLLIVLDSYGAGWLLLRWLSFHSRLESTVFRISIGLGAWAILLFLLGLCGWLYKPVIVTLTVAAALLTLAALVLQWKKKPSTQRLTPRNILVAFIACCCAAVFLVVDLYPPTAWDSTSYHLIIAREYLEHHGLLELKYILYPVLPALNHMLFTWALALSGDSVAQMTQTLFLFLTGGGIFAWCRRYSRASIGFAAAALWLAHPCVLWLGRAAYVDMGMTAFAFLGVCALWISANENEPRWSYVAYALFGFASATKLPGLFFLAAAACWTLFRVLRSQFHWKQAIAACAIALFCAAPFFAYITFHTGNPFWPMFHQYSKGVYADPAIQRLHRIFSWGVPRTLWNFLHITGIAIQQDARFNAPDHQTLAVPIMFWPIAWIVAVRDRTVRWWTAWALVYFAFWFLTSQQLRFLTPGLAMAGIALSLSISWLLNCFRLKYRAQNYVFFSAGILLLLFSFYITSNFLHIRGISPLTENGRQQFLTNTFAGYPAVSYINQNAKPGDVVYIQQASWLNYYMRPDFIDRNALLEGYSAKFQWPQDRPWLNHLKQRGVNWILMSKRAGPIPCWPEFPLVLEKAGMWIFQYQRGKQSCK